MRLAGADGGQARRTPPTGPSPMHFVVEILLALIEVVVAWPRKPKP